jgi:hypothetical protein
MVAATLVACGPSAPEYDYPVDLPRVVGAWSKLPDFELHLIEDPDDLRHAGC